MKKLSVFLALISLAIFFIFSCQKDKTYQAGDSANLETTISGIVLDESNAPLNGVTVSGYGQTTTTNQYGTFVLKNLNVNRNRCVLQFAKAGFFKRAQGFIPSGNTVNYVRIILVSNIATQNFSATAGGTFTLPDNSSVLFQPNSFVTSNGSTYTGAVNLIIKHLSPDDANFGFMIPGGDLAGKDLNNKDVALYTYGMLGVALTGSSGEALQLANGTTATLMFSIAASQLSSAPATIPLWYFDETTSLWKEEGAANKVGNNYVGTVKHFSWWNCDNGSNSPLIKGKVVDCSGIPIPNCVVTVNGWATTLTNQNGEYQGQVPSGLALTVQVLTSNNPSWLTQNSQLENVPALSPNQVYTITDLVVSCITRVAGTIKTCSGEASDGFVSISDRYFYTFQFTDNGLFNLPAIDNVQVNLFALNSSAQYSQNITTLSAPNDLNVGNLILCDSLNQNTNQTVANFILNGGPFSNQVFYVIPTNITAIASTSAGEIQIWISGTASPGFTITDLHYQFFTAIPSSTTCDFSLDMSDSANHYSMYGSLPCNLTEVGSVGNKIKANYSGSVNISVNSGNYTPGTISGSFDVVRTQ